MSDAVPFEFLRLDHVVLRARNADALTRFYCDVLGCRREREVAELGLVQLRAGVIKRCTAYRQLHAEALHVTRRLKVRARARSSSDC